MASGESAIADRVEQVFDAHLYPIDVPRGPQLSSPEGIEAFLADHGIARALLISRDSGLLSRHVEAVEGAYGMLWVNPREPDARGRAAQALAHPKLVGIKLHPAEDGFDPDDPVAHPIFELAEELGVPVSVHCGHPPPGTNTLPWRIQAAAARFPQVQVVLAHMGGCVMQYHEASMTAAERHPNVWLDVTGMPHNWRVLEAVRRAGPDRVLHGSFSPWFHPRLEVLKVLISDLTPDVVRKVLNDNAESLYLTRSWRAETTEAGA
ncbi:MAG TPA: amidohydrolase family protein [Baekduia sp.]|nr:amidohydrolase family protein [Baekduia sp.]